MSASPRWGSDAPVLPSAAKRKAAHVWWLWERLKVAALASNILHYVEPDLVETSHPYPRSAQPFVAGRTYAWRVQALDGEGRPVAANLGRSETRTFAYHEPAA